MSHEDLLRGLTPEQLKKARGCKSKQELLEVAKEEGIELTEEQLGNISGGLCQERVKEGFVCPNCLGTDTIGYFDSFLFGSRGGYNCVCNQCSARFEAK